MFDNYQISTVTRVLIFIHYPATPV